MKSRIIPTLFVICTVGIGSWFFWTSLHVPHTNSETDSAAPTNEPATDVVVLPQDKAKAAEIAVAPVTHRNMGRVATVPGRLQYDDTRHIEVKVPTAGTLTEVRVKPGDHVNEGDVLAVISSPEVGNARADVLKRESEYKLAQQKHIWERDSCEGLQQLIGAIKQEQSPQEISQTLDGLKLGRYRDRVMSAYLRTKLAEKTVEDSAPAAESGAISKKIYRERVSERDAANASLTSVIEQTLFEARQQCAIAELNASDANRRLRISEQHLQTLLGYDEVMQTRDESLPLSQVEVRAPFAGTVEAKIFSQLERVQQGDRLFVLADTSQLWVAADIREREWAALRLSAGQKIDVLAPAMPDEVFQAEIYYIGREVSPATNAVPVVATITNADGLLRPGQFVRVKLPLDEPRSVLAIPDSAIVEHDGVSFVFVQVADSSYQRVDVTRGLTESGWSEVTQGLEIGDSVVIHGAFYLKSELLLESEEG